MECVDHDPIKGGSLIPDLGKTFPGGRTGYTPAGIEPGGGLMAEGTGSMPKDQPDAGILAKLAGDLGGQLFDFFGPGCIGAGLVCNQ